MTEPTQPTAKPSASTAMVLLLLCAVGAGFLAFALQSQATSGAVMVGIALLFAVFARINQAQAHHRDLYAWRMSNKTVPFNDK